MLKVQNFPISAGGIECRKMKGSNHKEVTKMKIKTNVKAGKVTMQDFHFTA
jgi:hypothetical protein